MEPFEIVKNVHWIGARHPELRKFDDLMPTEHGTTYNSVLVRGEKVAIIDTVKNLFTDVFMKNVSSLVDPAEIDTIVVNHTEPDHSGSLAALLEAAPQARVCASKAARLYLTNLLNRPFECCTLDDCAEVALGGKTLRFISAPFLHWPDTIFTYLPEDEILFTCDAFGAHFCGEGMYNDLVGDYAADRKLYYDTLVRPFRDKVLSAVEGAKGLKLKIICPSHGPILRSDPLQYVQEYKNWATLQERSKPYIAVIYASAHKNTAAMAEAIVEGARRVDVDVDLLHITEVDEERIRTAMENADGLVFGSPTIVRDVPPPMWRVLSLLSMVKLRAKRAAAFGSYGWSGEAVPLIEQRLKDMRLSVMESGVRWKFTPTEEDLEGGRRFGKQFATEVSGG